MPVVKFHRVESLPDPLEADSIYFVKPQGSETATIHVTDSSGEVTAAQTQGPVGPEGPVGTTRGLIQLDFSGRYYMYSDSRWITQTITYGVAAANMVQSAGTEETANIPNNAGGHTVKVSDTISSIYIEAESNSSEIPEISIQLWHKGVASAGTETLLREWRTRAISGDKTIMVNESVPTMSEISMPSDGKLFLAIRPENRTGTSVRYAYVQAALRIRCDV